ncbi:MAG: FAD-linked oxidase C-terminal domain-containing protein, partial [Candidatus Bathyarchaeia archaeon]
LKLGNEYRIPVTPRGAGTSASGSPLAAAGGIVVDMSSMNRILKIDIENQSVTVEPGVVCDTLNESLAEYGFFFPPDPASSPACTIGGMVNTNAAGNRTIKYGPTRDWVLWLEVVLPNGEVIQTGSRTLKSASGFDLTRLIVGSEGSLGIVTQVGLKITPLPESYATSVLIFDNVRNLAKATTKIRRMGIVPEMIEFMNKKTATSAFEYSGIKDIPRGDFLLLDIGGAKESVGTTLERCLAIAGEYSPIYVEKTLDQAYRDKLVNARKAALPALARLRPTTVMEDCTVPPNRLPDAAEAIEQIPDKVGVEGIDLGNFGHVGDGNMHPTFVLDERVAEQRAAFFRGIDILYREIVFPMGGSCTGEHGIGLMRADYIELEHGAKAVQLMRSIKQLFDPNLILNPGKGKGGPYPLRRLNI